MENEAYIVRTINFEGPFGLLLSLIEERKLFINEISLAKVTEDYLNYVNSIGKLGPAEISGFIIVASTLILIKSKSLLPNLDLTKDEESDIKSLENRLKLYELYTKLGINLKNKFGKEIIFSPQERRNQVLMFLPDDQISKESMMTFAREAIGRIPKKVFLPEVEVRKVVSIEEVIDQLTNRIQNSLKINFHDFAGHAKTREEKVFVIVGFLAMLELVKGGILNAVQDNNFENIIIEKQEIIIN